MTVPPVAPGRGRRRPRPGRRPAAVAIGVFLIVGVAVGLIVVALTRTGTQSSSARPATSSATSPTASARPGAPSGPTSGNEPPTRTNTGDPSASPVPAPDGQAAAAERAAARFIVAYTERHYTDASPGSWVARAAPYATAAYAATLHARFDHAGADAAWTDLVSSRSDLSTAVGSARVDTGFHADADQRLVRVRYDSVRKRGAATVAGTDHRATLSLFMRRVAGRWLVDGVAAGGSAITG